MPHRVLVVDDDPDIRETVIEVLQESGHAAFGAANGVEALAQLREMQEPPCLILLDLMMPEMDGPTFRAELLKDPALTPIPVIVVSAFRETEEKARELGVAGHLTKPVSLSRLIELVESYC